MNVYLKRVIAYVLAFIIAVGLIPDTIIANAATTLTISTLSATSVESNSAVLRGTVNTNGGYEISEYWFAFREEGKSWTWTESFSGHIESGKTVTYKVTDLDPDTTYEFEFQACSTNDDIGTAYGGIIDFTTDSEPDTTCPLINPVKTREGSTTFEQYEEFTLYAMATDNIGLDFVSIYIDGKRVLQEDADGATKYTIEYDVDDLAVGTHKVYVYAEDLSGNWNETPEITITITPEEKEEPSISRISITPKTLHLGDSFTISGSVDGGDYEIDRISVSVFKDGGAHGVKIKTIDVNDDSYDLSDITGLYIPESYSCALGHGTETFAEDETLTVVVYALSEEYGESVESKKSFTLVPVVKTAPNISNFKVNQTTLHLGDSFTISGSVNGGDYEIDRISVSVFKDGGTHGVKIKTIDVNDDSYDLSDITGLYIPESYSCALGHGTETFAEDEEITVIVYALSEEYGTTVDSVAEVTLVPESEIISASILTHEIANEYITTDSIQVTGQLTFGTDETVESYDSVGIQYGTGEEMWIATIEASLNADGTFSATVTGLDPKTAYLFRAVAKNAATQQWLIAESVGATTNAIPVIPAAEIDVTSAALDKTEYLPGETIIISGVNVKNAVTVYFASDLGSITSESKLVSSTDDWAEIGAVELLIPETEDQKGTYHIAIYAENEEGTKTEVKELGFYLNADGEDDDVPTVIVNANPTTTYVNSSVTFTLSLINADKVEMVVGEYTIPVDLSEAEKIGDNTYNWTYAFSQAGDRSACFRAYNGSVEGELTAPIAITVNGLDTPKLITDTTIVVEYDTEVTIEWEPVPGAERYVCYVYDDGVQVGNTLDTGVETQAKYRFQEHCKSYSVQIYAVSGDGAAMNQSFPTELIVTVGHEFGEDISTENAKYHEYTESKHYVNPEYKRACKHCGVEYLVYQFEDDFTKWNDEDHDIYNTYAQYNETQHKITSKRCSLCPYHKSLNLLYDHVFDKTGKCNRCGYICGGITIEEDYFPYGTPEPSAVSIGNGRVRYKIYIGSTLKYTFDGTGENWEFVSDDPSVIKVLDGDTAKAVDLGTCTLYLMYNGQRMEGDYKFEVIKPNQEEIEKAKIAAEIENLPYDLTSQYQLASQIQQNTNSDLIVVGHILSQGVWGNAKEDLLGIIGGITGTNIYEESTYKDAIEQILLNVPAMSNAQQIDAVNNALDTVKNLKSLNDSVDNVTKFVSYLEQIYENPDAKVFEKLEEFADQVYVIYGDYFTHLGSTASDMSKTAMETIILQYKTKLEYFESLRANLPKGGEYESLSRAIDKSEEEYTNEYLKLIKKTAEESADEILEGIKTKGKSLVKGTPVASVLAGLDLVDYLMEIGASASGLGDYADGGEKLIALECVEALIGVSYSDAIVAAKKKIDRGGELTIDEYEYLTACYDLMRGCLITINKSAKLVDNRAEIVKQLNAEIAQLKSMSIHEYSGNEYYRDDFFVSPSAEINRGYYFDSIIDGGNHSDDIGIDASYNELSSIEKDIVYDTIEGLSDFADSFATSTEKSQFSLMFIETATGLHSGIIIEDASGNAMIMTCGNLYGNPCVKVVNSYDLHTQLANDRLDVNCVMSNGHVVGIDWALSPNRTTWTINKSGVECILREYVDNQQWLIHDEPQVATKRSEEFTMQLLKTVLEYNWWDDFNSLIKQGINNAYKPST